MKKIMNKMNFAIIALMASAAPAMAAVDNGVCNMIAKLGDVLGYIRLFAFVGAGFLIASWAWGYIKKGDVGLDDVKKNGMALLVGCFLLFMVGSILTFLISAAGPGGSFGCYQQLSKW